MIRHSPVHLLICLVMVHFSDLPGLFAKDPLKELNALVGLG
jgi:hypothetical protein